MIPIHDQPIAQRLDWLHRGCAGFHFDTEAAKTHTGAIRRQVERVFGPGQY